MSSAAPSLQLDTWRARLLEIEGQRTLARWAITAIAFGLLFWAPFTTLLRDWWSNPDAGHGLLLGPLAIVIAYRRGFAPGARAQPVAGMILLAGAVLLRVASGLGAELFTMRLSLLGGAGALVVCYLGFRQLLHWWLPTMLLLLSIPLPAVIVGSLALPLQLQASKMGAAMMDLRHVPVMLSGNVIHMPGRSLFVTEACSGLRSLTGLLALGVLIGGLWLRSPWLRFVLVAAAIPIAVVLNAVRIFLTGFSVYFISPSLGEGLMHYTEGWAIFVVAFLLLGALAWVFTRGEAWWFGRKAVP